jgi:phage protein D
LAAAPGGAGLITEAAVELSLTDMDSFTLQVLNWDEQTQQRRYVLNSIDELLGTGKFPFALGKPVQISMGYPSWERRLFTGEITRVRPVYPSGAPPMLEIEGTDGLHRLKGGVRNKGYAKKTDSEIVQAVVDLANKENKGRIRTEITPTTDRHEMIFQFDLTDAGFLKQRATEIGFEVFMREETLCFRPPAEKERTEQLVLEWGKTLESLEVAVNLGEQASQVEVRGWDPEKKAVISYKTTDGDLQAIVGKGLSGAKAREKLFGGSPVVMTNVPVRTKGEAKAMAQARLRRALESFITARGATFGLPDLRPGGTVVLKEIDPLLAGAFYLTRCSHRFGASGYRTEFEARRLSL